MGDSTENPGASIGAQPSRRGQNRYRRPRGPSGGENRGGRSNRGRSRQPVATEMPEGFNFDTNAPPFVPSVQTLFDQVQIDFQQNVNVTASSSRGRGSRGRGNRNRPRELQETLSSFPQASFNNDNRGQNSRGGRGKNTRGRGARGRRDTSEGRETYDNIENLRERLIKQLENNCYECVICYQKVTTKQGIWSCKTCFHIFHVSNGCIINWARSNREGDDNNQWACPMCKTKNDQMPYTPYCFCRKQKNPKSNPGDIPHSCGGICGGERTNGCPHPCTEVCHPGPCPKCTLQVSKSCKCGKTERVLRCGTTVSVYCSQLCGKKRNCKIHDCQGVCHGGECSPCDEVIQQVCFCGEETREALCSDEGREKYSCGKPCDGYYECGVHKCPKSCHPNVCGHCPTATSRITACPCGKRTLQELDVTREKCTDEIPTCGQICDKQHECGVFGKPHRCKVPCHTGPCPPCPDGTFVICRCGLTRKTLPCAEYLEILKSETGFLLCERRCRKRKSCGLHKCQETCCDLAEHFCFQICNKKLPCGNHTCENICHAGQCPRCLHASFEEQYCNCGQTVREPPIGCGVPPPECRQPCTRQHGCDHSVTHNCHNELTCPPCLQLADKECFGRHETRKMKCNLSSYTCGRVCTLQLHCQVHNCVRTCHLPPCEKENEPCRQKCSVLRAGCEHECGQQCHGLEPCPDVPCSHKLQVTCGCGRIKKPMKCKEAYESARKKEEPDDTEKTKKKEKKNRSARNTPSPTPSRSSSTSSPPPLSETPPPRLVRSASLAKLNFLECDAECKKLERNKKLAEALELETNDDGQRIFSQTISYTDYLKTVVKSGVDFVLSIENTFNKLLAALNDPTNCQEVIVAHLQPMSIEKRRFVHEYGHYFLFETESVDQPPKRSCIIRAKRGRSRPPEVLLSDLAKYKGVLNTPGPSVITKDELEGSTDQLKVETSMEETEMKPLKETKMVVKREPKQVKLASPIPAKTFNRFELLNQLNEDNELAKEKKEVDWWKVEQKQKKEAKSEDVTEGSTSEKMMTPPALEEPALAPVPNPESEEKAWDED